MRSLRRQINDTLTIVAGTGLMAVAVSCVYAPMGMVTGGFTGIAIMVQHITQSMIPGGIPLGISNLLLNIPVFIWAYRRKNRRFLMMTMLATALLSTWLIIVSGICIIQDDYLLASLLGGALAGAGIGMILRAQATTGGTDLLAVLIHEHMRHRTVVEILMMIDAVIVIAGLGIFGLKSALYAMIAIYMTTKVSDRLTEGVKFAKGALIITSKEQQVAQEVMTKMERGVTSLVARGMYSGKERGMLYSVVSKKEMVCLKEIVYEKDPEAFITVMDVREVLGEGFGEFFDEKKEKM